MAAKDIHKFFLVQKILLPAFIEHLSQVLPAPNLFMLKLYTNILGCKNSAILNGGCKYFAVFLSNFLEPCRHYTGLERIK